MDEFKIYKTNLRIRNVIFFATVLISLFVCFIYTEIKFLEGYCLVSGLIFNMTIILVEGIVIIFLTVFMIKVINKIYAHEPFLIFGNGKIICKGAFSNDEINLEDIKDYSEVLYKGRTWIVLSINRESDYFKLSSFMKKIMCNYNVKRVGGEYIFRMSFLGDEYENVLTYISHGVK